MWGKKPEAPDHSTRPPAVAGYFYPDDPGDLTDEVDRHLASVVPAAIPGRILALVSPHAGYRYSGPVAACGYAQLRNQVVHRAIIISPCHVEAFEGCSIFHGESYQTPLGSLPVDRDLAAAIVARSGAVFADAGHRSIGQRGEHALEVQLPFLQRTAGAIPIVPIVMGQQNVATAARLAFSLDGLLDEGTLLIASSDLSHHHPDRMARDLDQGLVAAIGNFDYYLLESMIESRSAEACGAGPIQAAMIAAQRAGADRAQILKYATSAEVPPYQTDAVVGYLCAALVQSGTATATGATSSLDLTPEAEKLALGLAKDTVRRAVTKEEIQPPEAFPPVFSRPAAVFVSLHSQGRLRGCVGTILGQEPLETAIRTAAVNASLYDHRFAPVQPDELGQLDYELSILSPFRLIRGPQEVRIGRDGLMIERGQQRGLLLPQVATEQHWDAPTFLAQTCRKAGLSPDAWNSPPALVYAFSARVIGEE